MTCLRNPRQGQFLLQRRRRGEGGGDTGNDGVGYAARIEHFHLLLNGAVHRGIAGMQPHHAAAGGHRRGHQRHDLIEGEGGAIVRHGARLQLRQERPIDQGSGIDDHIRRLQSLQPLDGDQLRIARPGADEENRGFCTGSVHSEVLLLHDPERAAGDVAGGKDGFRISDSILSQTASRQLQTSVFVNRSTRIFKAFKNLVLSMS